MPKNFLFTSESVAPGHPDKFCDQISDMLLDLYLEKDPESRVAIEALATINNIVLAGEVRAPSIDKEEIELCVRNLVKEIGFRGEGTRYDTVKITNLIHRQSSDIAMGVDESHSKEEGAGDQGIMFGYACDETEDFMPAPIHYSHRVLEKIFEEIKSKKGASDKLALLGPDAKSQITFEYRDGKPFYADKILISIQHDESLSVDDVKALLWPIVLSAIPKEFMHSDSKFIVNPTGRFVIGGPEGDTGLTGRKIIVDTYGGSAPHGGGAFSGKDPTKVDRSAAYMARYLAKNIVASGLAKRCTIQLSYAIGRSQPMSLYVNNHDTGVPGDLLAKFLVKNFDLSPKGIRKFLKLNSPIYQKTATFGHFGRKAGQDGSFSWEKLDSINIFKGI